MKITIHFMLGLVLSCGVAGRVLAQLPAGAKVQGIYSKDDQQRRAREKEQEAVRARAEWQAANQPYRVEMWVPEPGYNMPAGYGYAPAMAYVMPVQPASNNEPVAGDVQAAGHNHVPGNPHMMGGGTFPYGSAYDHGHPGKLFDGGRYGYFGGAHRTPGYPHHHHHFNREYVGPQGPPTAAVAYPYYTTRGPRDFLQDNPPSIGR